MRKLLISALLILATCCTLASCSQLSGEGTFSISVAEDQLALSESRSFENASKELSFRIIENIDNSTLSNYLDQKLSDIRSTDGLYKGEGADSYYFAATFYLKNEGDESVTYRESISLDCTQKGMEKALRILIIKDADPDDDDLGLIEVYAAPTADGEAEEVVPTNHYFTKGYMPQADNGIYQGFTFDEEDIREDGVWMSKPFVSDTCAMKGEKQSIVSKQVVKYTLLVWLEGNDEQCTDEILGGKVDLSLKFEEN